MYVFGVVPYHNNGLKVHELFLHSIITANNSDLTTYYSEINCVDQ